MPSPSVMVRIFRLNLFYRLELQDNVRITRFAGRDPRAPRARSWPFPGGRLHPDGDGFSKAAAPAPRSVTCGLASDVKDRSHQPRWSVAVMIWAGRPTEIDRDRVRRFAADDDRRSRATPRSVDDTIVRIDQGPGRRVDRGAATEAVATCSRPTYESEIDRSSCSETTRPSWWTVRIFNCVERRLKASHRTGGLDGSGSMAFVKRGPPPRQVSGRWVNWSSSRRARPFQRDALTPASSSRVSTSR